MKMIDTLKKIEEDIQSGFKLFSIEKITRTVLIWGSARILSKEIAEKLLQKAIQTDDEMGRQSAKNKLQLAEYYEQAMELSRRLSLWGKENFPKNEQCLICSGGSGGIMEAANRGAKAAGCHSLGINIKIPTEQQVNPYVTHRLEMQYFFTRKYLFMKWAIGLVVFPGGFGTLDESFEALNLLQTETQRKSIPIVFFGKDFWQKLINFEFLYETDLAHMRENIYFANTVDEAFKFITDKK